MYLINTKESLKHAVVKLHKLSLANKKSEDKAMTVYHTERKV